MLRHISSYSSFWKIMKKSYTNLYDPKSTTKFFDTNLIPFWSTKLTKREAALLVFAWFYLQPPLNCKIKSDIISNPEKLSELRYQHLYIWLILIFFYFTFWSMKKGANGSQIHSYTIFLHFEEFVQSLQCVFGHIVRYRTKVIPDWFSQLSHLTA